MGNEILEEYDLDPVFEKLDENGGGLAPAVEFATEKGLDIEEIVIAYMESREPESSVSVGDKYRTLAEAMDIEPGEYFQEVYDSIEGY